MTLSARSAYRFGRWNAGPVVAEVGGPPEADPAACYSPPRGATRTPPTVVDTLSLDKWAGALEVQPTTAFRSISASEKWPPAAISPTAKQAQTRFSAGVLGPGNLSD